MSATKTCPSCGTAASESERFCANCGSRLPEAAPADAAPPAPTIRLPEAEPPAPTIRLPEATPPPDSAPRLPGAGPAQSLPGDSFGAPPPPPRKGLPVWAIVLLAVVGLCGVGCIATFAIAGFVLPGAIDEAATAVMATVEVELAPTERPATSSGGNQNPAPSPTAGVVLSLPTKEPSGGVATDDIFAEATEAFRDEFEDNSNGWLTGQVGDYEIDTIEDGVFKAEWSGKDASYETYGVRDFTNVIVELDCRVERGGTDGACGIIFSETEEVGYYRFQVYEDYYSLYMIEVGADNPPLLEGDPSDLINPGDWNRLRVVRQGEEISIYLNDELLGTVSDSTYTTGYVGVSTASFSESGGVEVWFDNFTIWELP